MLAAGTRSTFVYSASCHFNYEHLACHKNFFWNWTTIRNEARQAFKSGKTRSSLTRSMVRGEALKERSEGDWRSGRRRSGDVGGGGTVNQLPSSVSCRESTEHTLCQNHRQTLISHRDLPLQSDRFLIGWIYRDRAQRILPRLTSITSFEKYLA